MRKVRIARNRVNSRQALMRFLRLVQVLLGIYQKHTRAADHNYIVEARHAKVLKDTEVAEYRKRKLMNDLVIQDLKIEQLNKELGHNPGDEFGKGVDLWAEK